MDTYITTLTHLVEQYSYSIVFVALILENALMLGYIVPGVLVLVLSGFFAATGKINVALCILAGTTGTIVGDNINYVLGKYGAKKIRFVQRLLQKHSALRSHLEEQSVLYFIFFHFPVYLRTIFPFILGASDYNFKQWIWIDITGAIIFNTTFILTGYLIGISSGAFSGSVDLGNKIVIFFSGVFIFWIARFCWTYYKRSKKKTSEV
ncbi:MAG TPA: DedA family protein [Candidatus Kapabacteria bacterium]|nr:DedA family protein [Candidatus Kapabacteria bacterium]